MIHAGTHLVPLNVVAVDKHGKPIDDLTRDDFVVRDNGQEQKITLFALERSAGTAASSAASQHLTFTNRPAPGVSAVTAFLFDELNTQITDQEAAKKDFIRYLRGLPADGRFAVFVLGDSLQILHDFSQDTPSLLAALDKHKNRVNPELQAVMTPAASSNSLTGDQTSTALWDSFMEASAKPYADFTRTVRATRTAAALQTIAGYLEGVPGRKTLIWISGGFPIELGLYDTVDSMAQGARGGRSSSGATRGGGVRGSSASAARSGAGKGQSLPPASLSNGELPGADQSFANDVARAIRALNESDVAVYPVDARGVPVAAAFEADRSSMGKRGKPPKAVAAPDFDYETLDTLALETGGKSFHHINDLSSAIQEAAGDARVSYSLAFSPAVASLDGTYHKLEVTVKPSGARLRYRPGYVAARDAAITPALADAIANPVALAGIGFSVHLDPVEGGYKASMTLDARNITLESKDGKWTGSLQFLVLVGKTAQLTTIPLSFSDAMLRQIQERGLTLSARVKTPPGTTGFSLGFRDIPSGQVGTLHIPLT